MTMSVPATLGYTAKLVCVDTLLFGNGFHRPSQQPHELTVETKSGDSPLENNVTQGEYLLQLLETDCFTAVSEDILERIVEHYPSRLTNRLLEALLPPYTREINLPECKDKLTLMGLLEGLKKCSHIQRLNLQGCSQLLHPDIFTLMGLINGQLTTLILEGNNNVTDEIVQTAIRALPNLTTLNISGSSSITDDVFFVDPILQLKRETSQKMVKGDYSYKLSSVDLSGISRITSVAVRHLCSLCGPNLRQLNLAWSAVDSTVLFYLAGYNFPSIIDLVLGMETELRKERELKEYLQELKEIKNLYLLQEEENHDGLRADVELSNSTVPDVTTDNVDKQQVQTVCEKLDEDLELSGVSDQFKIGSESFGPMNVTEEKHGLDNCGDLERANTAVQLEDVEVDVSQDSSLNVLHEEKSNSCFERESSGEMVHFERDSADREGNSSKFENVRFIEPFGDDARSSLIAEGSSIQCENIKLTESFENISMRDGKDLEKDNFDGAENIVKDQNIHFLAKKALNAAERISEVVNKDESEVEDDMDSETDKESEGDQEMKSIIHDPYEADEEMNTGTNQMLCELERDNEFHETSAIQGNVRGKFVEKLNTGENDIDSCFVCFKLQQQLAHSRSVPEKSLQVNSQQNLTHSADEIIESDSEMLDGIEGQSLEDDLSDNIAFQTELGAGTYAKNSASTEENIKANAVDGNQLDSKSVEMYNKASNDNLNKTSDTKHESRLYCDKKLGALPEKDVNETDENKISEGTNHEAVNSDIEKELKRYTDGTAGLHCVNTNQNTASSHCDISDLSDKNVTDKGIEKVSVLTRISSLTEIVKDDQGAAADNAVKGNNTRGLDTDSKPGTTILSEDNKSSVFVAQNTDNVEAGSQSDTDHANKIDGISVTSVTCLQYSEGALSSSTDRKKSGPSNEESKGNSGDGGFPCQILFKPGLVSLDITNIKFMNRKLGQLCLKTFLQQNPCLQKLELSWKGLTEELLKEVLPNLHSLLEVSLEECTFIQNGGLSALLKHCQQLRNINLRGVVFIKDMAMSPLYTMENLTKLNLAESEISDATLFRISNRCSEKLTELDLSWCEGITEKGINYICLKCSQLQSLVLRSCPVSNITLQVMAKHCLQLTELIIDSVEGVSANDFGDMGLTEVAENLFQLQTLDISWNLSITNLAVSLLMSNLSKLREVHMKGLKQITCTPFLPIISGIRDEDGEVNEFWIDEYCNNIMTAGSLKRSTAFVPDLSVLDLEYSDLVEDKRLELIVKVCRGSLLVTDYYGRQLVPDDSSSLVISSASVRI